MKDRFGSKIAIEQDDGLFLWTVAFEVGRIHLAFCYAATLDCTGSRGLSSETQLRAIAIVQKDLFTDKELLTEE